MNLARGAVPAYLQLLTYDPLSFTNTGRKWARVDYGFREELKLAFDFIQSYGDLALGADRRGPVAVLASWHQGIFMPPRENSYGGDLWELVGALYLANYPATFLYESDIEAGRLAEFEVLMVTGQGQPLPARTLAALETFVEAGGVILANTNVTAEMPVTQRVELGLGEWWQWSKKRNQMLKQRESMKRPKFGADDFQQAECYRVTLKHRDKLQELLGRYVKPFADCRLPFVFCSTLQTGEGRLVFVINDVNTGLPGPRNTRYELVSFNRPVRTDVGLAATDGHVYDLWTQEEVGGEIRDNRKWIRADLTRHAFRAYYHVPVRPERLELSAPADAPLGSHLSVNLRWLDRAGETVTFPVPVEIALTDADDRVLTKLRREVPARSRRVALKIPLNASPGRYRLMVTNLLDGHRFEQSLAVGPAGSEWGGGPVTAGSDVLVLEAERVHEFLAQRDYALVMAEGQPMAEAVRGLAARLDVPVKAVEDVATDIHGWLVYRKDAPVWPRTRSEEPMLLVGGARATR